MAGGVRGVRWLATSAVAAVLVGVVVLGSAPAASAHLGPQPHSPSLGLAGPTHPVIVGADFESATIPVGGTTRLSFSVTNPNLDLTVTGIGFEDVLPAGLVVAAAPVVRPEFCDVTVNAPPAGGVAGATLSALAGSSVIGLSNLTLLPGQPCTFDVDVTTAPGASAGSYTTTIGPVSTENAGPGAVLGPAVLTVTTPGSSLGGAEGSPAWTPQSTGVSQSLRAVSFVDADDGWAVGEDGVVLGTSDGGGTWSQLSNTSGKRLTGVSFVDQGEGWAVGIAGTILHTVSAGFFWSAQTSAGQVLNGVSFADATHGWAVGASGTILATANAGKTWTRQPSGTSADLFGVSFSRLGGAYVGVAVGEGGTVLRTLDGGASWAPVPSGTISTLWGVSVNGLGAWAVGDEGAIVHASVTSDFAPQSSPTSATLSAVSFVDEEHGIAVGDGGTILGTSDGGQTWVQEPSGTTQDLFGVALSDSGHAWAVGDGGTILTSRTGLGGASPGTPGPGQHRPNRHGHGNGHGHGHRQHHGHGRHNPPGLGSSPVQGPDLVMSFVPSAIPVGGTASLRFTLYNLNRNGETLSGVNFRDALPSGLVVVGPIGGFIGTCGDAVLDAPAGDASIALSNANVPAGSLCRFSVDVTTAAGASPGPYTTATGPVGSDEAAPAPARTASLIVTSSVGAAPGPATWSPQATGVPEDLTGVSFVDGDGWAVGMVGVILKTSDGTTWNRLPSPTGNALTSVSFVDPNHGWAVGPLGTIVATTDGGASWTTETSGTSQFLLGVSFANDAHGWAVGTRGTILATTDGGKTWTPQQSGTTADLYAVSFPQHPIPIGNLGVAVGTGGTILTTGNGGTSWTRVPSGTTTTLRGVSVTNRLSTWAVGDGGTILHASRTSGFAPQSSSTGAGLWSVSFVGDDERYGVAVGDGGTIVSTFNGGATWVQQSSGTTQLLRGVSLADPSDAWAVGDSGTILASTTPFAGLGSARLGTPGPGQHRSSGHERHGRR